MAGDPVETLPIFGDSTVRRLSEVVSPAELYARLLELEANVPYFEPAHRFVSAALAAAAAAPVPDGDDRGFVEGLIAQALGELQPCRTEAFATSWRVAVAREFGPMGLCDGVWLQGLAQMNILDDRAGMAVLKSLMLRVGGPGDAETYAERYAALLRSLGIAPGTLGRTNPAQPPACLDVSYEHALLPASLALFCSTLRPETIGFNLWMATVGPCPLLAQVASGLPADRAQLGYLHDARGAELGQLARQAALYMLEDGPAEGRPGWRARLARGFWAAQRSYQRWEQAVAGGNLPATPRDCVLGIIGRKARFALGQHGAVMVGDRSLEAYFAGDPRGHDELLDRLARSSWVSPEAPEHSPLVQATSFGGPMFDVFTASERQDLIEWIASLRAADRGAARPAPVALQGGYGPPQDADSLEAYAAECFGKMNLKELLYALVNADRFPAVRLFAKGYATRMLGMLSSVLDNDETLKATPCPEYSDAVLANIVAEYYRKNVESRAQPNPGGGTAAATAGGGPGKDPYLQVLLDGGWLQGFADVGRAHLDEYGLLFRIYASENGDGDLSWNHNYISRKSYAGYEPEISLPLIDPRLFKAYRSGIQPVIMFALTLNHRHFLPELLGLNLAIEAAGVGGFYLTDEEKARAEGNEWKALYFRLHNSIDNFATGHTAMSVTAVQAYMARLREVAPETLAEHWRRAWRVFRVVYILSHGTKEEKGALSALGLGGGAAGFVPSAL